jgi:predicted SprT family Zn-dependent metalloprotease
MRRIDNMMYVTEEQMMETGESLVNNIWEELVSKYSSLRGWSKPEFVIKKRGFKTVATAYHLTNRIVFNSNFLYTREIENKIEEVIRHELAHMVNRKLYNGSGHRGTFRYACEILGVPAKSTVSLGFPENRVVYIFQCECGKKYTANSKGEKTSMERGRYRCRSCKTNLKYATLVQENVK